MRDTNILMLAEEVFLIYAGIILVIYAEYQLCWMSFADGFVDIVSVLFLSLYGSICCKRNYAQ